ncbi:Nudix hydrolase 16, mitochondrial [Linum perenne]
MSELVARTGRHQQRYEGGCRLVAGCIPFRYRECDENGDNDVGKVVEVLMINSTSGPGLLFPKVYLSTIILCSKFQSPFRYY